MIWATVSSRSCFCWLYRASSSSAAKNIINLSSTLTIWWYPCVECRVFSCVVGRGCLLWPVCSLVKTLLAFALLHFVLQGQTFLFLLAILWNSAFKWVYLSFSPLPFASLLFSAICKAYSDNQIAFLNFFFLEMVLVITSSTMLWTLVHSSTGTLSTRSSPLSPFVTSTV